MGSRRACLKCKPCWGFCLMVTNLDQLPYQVPAVVPKALLRVFHICCLLVSPPLGEEHQQQASWMLLQVKGERTLCRPHVKDRLATPERRLFSEQL